jgi:hypothetical protein
MKTRSFVPVVLQTRAAFPIVFILGAAACLAGEPEADQPREQAVVEMEQPEVLVGPVRKLVFSDADAKHPLNYSPDAELPKQRYAATFSVTFRFPSFRRGIPSEVAETLQSEKLVYPEFDNSKQQAWLSELVERMPEDSRPPADLVDELLSPGNPWFSPLAVRRFSSRGDGFVGGSPGRSNYQITVLAADKERLEDLVRAVVLAIDMGSSAQNHASYAATEQKLQERIEEQSQEASTLEEEIAAVQKELEKSSSFNDLTPEAMANLVVQKRMIDVDVAGIEARLKACARILDGLRDATLRSQVETVKVTAEIELAGLAAKGQALNEIITIGRHRAEADETIKGNKREVSQLQSRQKAVSAIREQYTAAIQERWAYPEVSMVTVSKILWTPSAAPSQELPGGGFH